MRNGPVTMWVWVVLSGCADELRAGERLGDPAPGEITVQIGALPVRPVSGDLEVTGTAEHSGGLAIVQLEVQGRPATADLPGFRAWSITLPHADLVAWSDEADGALEICARGRGVGSGWSDETCAGLHVAEGSGEEPPVTTPGTPATTP